jgi:hypothetical protein
MHEAARPYRSLIHEVRPLALDDHQDEEASQSQFLDCTYRRGFLFIEMA